MADGDRILAQLPAVFAQADATGDLRRLASVLEALLFGEEGDAATGYERRIERIPALFAPLAPIAGLSPHRTPDHQLGWLADWLSFTPHALFAPARLRAILAGIVPLNGSRGTRRYLEALLALAFGDAIASVVIDDEPHAGLAVGGARVGVDARIGRTPPFCFNVTVAFAPAALEGIDPDAARAHRERLRALIDYGKPGHASYALSSNLP